MSATFNIDCLQLTLYTNLCKSSNPELSACCLAMHNDIYFKSICNKHDVPSFPNASCIKILIGNKFSEYCFE